MLSAKIRHLTNYLMSIFVTNVGGGLKATVK